MSQYDTQTLFDFLAHTPEGGLRKMLIDRKTMTDVHCNLLLKVVKSCSAEQFGEHFEQQSFPKIRTSPAEDKIKEKFWQDCTATFLERGILQKAPAPSHKEAA
jgi:hypothetical protein